MSLNPARALGAAVAVVGAALLMSCAPRPPRELRIGLLALLDGELAPQSGEPSRDGALLAVDELNAAGGVDVGGTKRRVRLIVKSYALRADAAASAARDLVNLDSVDVVIGPQLSAHAIAASAVAEDAHVPMITPMASNPQVTAGKPHVFRLAFLDPFQGEMLARYALDDLHARRAAVLYDVANAYGSEIAKLFSETFTKGGGAIVASETFTTDQKTDFTAALRRIAATGADVLLLPNYSAVDSFQVRQARAVGVNAVFLGSDNWDPPSMRHIPEALGSVFTHQWSPTVPLPKAQAFVSRYRTRFGVTPRSTAALTYDAILIAADAAHRAGATEGDALAKAIMQTTGYEGATGTITFGGSSDPRRTGIVSRLGETRDSILRLVTPQP